MSSEMICPRCKRSRNKFVRGYCRNCYNTLLNNGTLLVIPKPVLPERLTDQQNQILTGLMLGDGCVQYSRPDGKNPRLTMTRKADDKGYLDWQYQQFNDFYSSPPKTANVFDERTNKIYPSCYSATRSCPIFIPWREKWYPEGIKIVPKDLQLTPLIIAIWFCDDGSIYLDRKYLKGKFSTDGFCKDDVNFLQSLLSERYNENFCVWKNDDGFVVGFSSKSANKLIEEIEPFIPSCMNRKRTWAKI